MQSLIKICYWQVFLERLTCQRLQRNKPILMIQHLPNTNMFFINDGTKGKHTVNRPIKMLYLHVA